SLRVQHRPDDSADSKQRHGEDDDDAHGHHSMHPLTTAACPFEIALEVSHHHHTPTPIAAATNVTPKAMSPNVAPRHPRSRRSTSGGGPRGQVVSLKPASASSKSAHRWASCSVA